MKLGRNIGPSESHEDRTELFKAAFADDPVLPKPNKLSYRVNNKKAAKLSFNELMQLQSYVDEGVEYQDLPAWLRDAEVLEVDADEKKRQRELTKETGLDLTERQFIYNSFRARCEALAELSVNPVVKDSDVMMINFDLAAEKFGADQIMGHLQENFPNAAEFFEKKLMIRTAETKAAEGNAVEQQTREELQQAKQHLAMMERFERGSEVND